MSALPPLLRRALALALAALFASAATAQTRRALLVGIDTYAPPPGQTPPGPAAARAWTNLEGAVNDADAVAAVLQARYDFAPADVRVLRNGEATRDGILAAVREHLVAPTQPGDVVVFYFAGHGSQVRNRADTEGDGLDETLVPADAWRGTPDLRDKELRDLFNEVLDRTGDDAHVLLVVDACHSGSITRGVTAGRTRQLPPSDAVVDDASDLSASVRRPEDRGALVLSAAREDELAREVRGDDGTTHGALTWALLQVLQTMPAGQTASEAFARTRALMRSAPNVTQEPQLAGTQARRRRPLFGGSARPGGTRVAVLEADGATVTLQGGQALGLEAGAGLTAVTDAADPVRLVVTGVDGLTRARARRDGGTGAVRPGDLFEVTTWVAPASAPLRLHRPAGTLAHGEVVAAAARFDALRRTPGVAWVDDPTETAPDHVLRWDGGAWVLRHPDGTTTRLGAHPDAPAVAAALRPADGPAHLWAALPPFTALDAALTERLRSVDAAVEVVDAFDDADYVLAGRRTGADLTYAWILLGATVDGNRPAEPPRSDWLTLAPDRLTAAVGLATAVSTLHRVWGWMRLQSAPDDGTFPYRVAGFEPVAGGPLREAGATLRGGERFRLVLRASREALDAAEVALAERRGAPSHRYVYVFAIDRSGSGVLLYPRSSSGATANLVDVLRDGTEVRLPRSETASLFVVQPPYGVDSFFVLTSEEAITDPQTVFTFSGAATRSGRAPLPGDATPLGRLLYGVGSGSRDAGSRAVPTRWSIERIRVLSEDR